MLGSIATNTIPHNTIVPLHLHQSSTLQELNAGPSIGATLFLNLKQAAKTTGHNLKVVQVTKENHLVTFWICAAQDAMTANGNVAALSRDWVIAVLQFLCDTLRLLSLILYTILISNDTSNFNQRLQSAHWSFSPRTRRAIGPT